MPNTTFPPPPINWQPWFDTDWRRFDSTPGTIAPTPPNHGTPWSQEDDDLLIELFGAGAFESALAERFGRTATAIRSRLSYLMGLRWPDRPENYRERARSMAAGRQVQPTPREDRLIDDVLLTLFPEQAQGPSRISRRRRVSPAPRTTPRVPTTHEPEVPSHLQAVVPLGAQQYQAMAQEIRNLRSTQEGRIAAAQNSTLNKLAYRLASLFEGENSSFDRTQWLEACGVTTQGE